MPPHDGIRASKARAYFSRLTGDSAAREYWHYFDDDNEDAYPRFFVPRAKVLRAYAEKIGLADLATKDPRRDYRELSRSLSLYIERLPTWSRKFSSKGFRIDGDESFLLKLNSLSSEVVLKLLQPKVVLLAGHATWNWQKEGQSHPKSIANGKWVRVEQTEGCAIVRCKFLRTIGGPNSDRDLSNLGELLGLASQGVETSNTKT